MPGGRRGAVCANGGALLRDAVDVPDSDDWAHLRDGDFTLIWIASGLATIHSGPQCDCMPIIPWAVSGGG